MAKRNRTGTQAGLNAGNATNGAQEAQRLNRQAATRAGDQANYEFGRELGTTGAAGGLNAGGANNGARQARQLNQKAAQEAARKAGR